MAPGGGSVPVRCDKARSRKYVLRLRAFFRLAECYVST